MKRILTISIVAILTMILIGGCTSLLVHFASTEKLATFANEAAIKQLQIANAQIAKLNNTITDLRASKAGTYSWILYLFGGFAVVFGLAAGYYFGQIKAGLLTVLGGVILIGTVRFLDRYPWSPWIIFGLVLLIGLYLAWDWWRTKQDAENSNITLKAVVPAIEKVEPKIEGILPSGPVKAAIAANAAKDCVTEVVQAKVAEVKASL